MTIRLLLFISILLSGFALSAQDDVATLQAAIEKAEGREKASFQLALAKKMRSTDVKEAFKLAEDAQKASLKGGWTQLALETSQFLAQTYFAEQNYKRSSTAAEEALAAARQLKDDKVILESLAFLIRAYTAENRGGRRMDNLRQEYAMMKARLDLQDKSEAISSLEDDVEKASGEMNFMSEKLEITEEEKRALAAEKDRLEMITMSLKYDSSQQALELAKQEIRVSELDAKARKQRNQLTFAGLFLVFVLLISFIWIRSIREKRKQEAQQAILKQQLLQKDKMATLGEMTAGLAHEIKNPLNFVNNFAEGSIDLLSELKEYIDDNLNDKVDEPDLEEINYLVGELSQNASDISAQGRRADTIINSMMDHARNDTAETTLTDINSLLIESWYLAYDGQKEKSGKLAVELEQNLAQNLPKIRVLSQNLSRAFVNIFTNSMEAFAENNIDHPVVSVSTKKSDKMINITIRDNAGGVPKDLHKKIFNPFFTTKPTGKGNTGLGLSITHDIIEKGHDGVILLQSDGNSFTEIIVKLPLVTG